MDRREALKRLGASGAVIVGGSMVVSSNAVAATCSPLPVAPDAPFTVTRIRRAAPNNNQMLVQFNPAANPPGGTPQFGWQITSYSNLGRRIGFRIRETGGADILRSTAQSNCASVCTPGFTSDNLTHGNVILSRVRPNGVNVGFGTNNTNPQLYTVRAKVTWTFSNGCAPLTAEYVFSGRNRAVTVAKV